MDAAEFDKSRMPSSSSGGGGGGGGGEWVTVGEYANGHEADLAVALLAGQDIPSSLENREFVGMDWGIAAAVGWIKVNVPVHLAGAARVTLSKMERSGRGDLNFGEGEALVDAEACLRCGGAMPVGDAVCDACGWSYEEAAEAE